MERNEFDHKLNAIVDEFRYGTISLAQTVSRFGLLLEKDQETTYKKRPDCEDGFIHDRNTCCNTCGGTNRVEAPRD